MQVLTPPAIDAQSTATIGRQPSSRALCIFTVRSSSSLPKTVAWFGKRQWADLQQHYLALTWNKPATPGHVSCTVVFSA